MQMKQVRILKAHPYGNEKRKPGQICHVRADHFELLRTIGLITADDSVVVKKPLADFHKMETAEPFNPMETIFPEPAEESVEIEKPRRRHYRRRDMEPED